MLKAEGFDVSTSTLIDIQKVLANLGDEMLVDFSELRSIISPLICRNKEEQEHFNAIFHKYETYIKEKSDEPFQAAEINIKKPNYKKIILIGLGSILLLSAIIYFFLQPAKHFPSINVVTVFKDSSQYLLTGETVLFRAEVKDTIASKKYFITFRINDSVYEHTREIKKKFNEKGNVKLIAWLFNDKGDTLNSFEGNDMAVYCENPPSVTIVKDADEINKASQKKYLLQFTNGSDDGNYKYKWYVNDSLVSDSSALVFNHKSVNAYTVKAIIDTKKSFKCTDSLTALLYEKPAYDLSVIGTKRLPSTADIDWKKIGLAGLYTFLLPLSLAALTLFFRKKKALQKKKVETEYDEPKEYTGPYKIEFKDQVEKISAEKEISQLAEAMRKRHVNDLLFLNVPKTIQSTIRSGGFPLLQFTPRTQPTDFLVFIDKENAEGLQVKLFEYLIKKLETEQVNISSYSFYKEPLLLSNEKMNQSMLPIDKIARLYPNTILFIFSDTREFFGTLSTKLKPWVNDKFKSWDHKIILTPVPVSDWDYKENTLVEAGFTVVPADLNAHHIIVNEINNLINRQKIQHIIIPMSYSSRFVNFDEWAQLTKYLDEDPLLIQWVSALAVYPYIDWKATVAIGKALEEQNSSKKKSVTYTNLLRLSRIKWMQTGLIPDSLRLEMLSHLSNDSEVIARETMLELFHEVEENITTTSMIADEFELNKTVNKFLLHTRNPAQYEISAEENERMKNYVENQWLDQPLGKYLDSADNTLLKDSGGNKSISPAEYFKIEDTIANKKLRREKMMRRSLAAAILLTGFFFMYKFFAKDSNYKAPRQFSDINFNLEKNSVLSSFKNVQFSITGNNKTYNGEIISDTSVIVKNVPIDTSQQVTLSFGDSSANFEKLINLTSQEYIISINPPKAALPLDIRYNNAASYAAMEQRIASAFSDYNISALQSDFSDSSRIVYYANNQKARADSVAQIVKDNFGINVKTEFITQLKAPGTTPVLFLNLIKNVCNNIAANALPASLNEIWSGGTSRRLINIMPNKKLIYYSTGDKKTYGTYRIEEICLNTKGMYRIITNAGNGYQDFLIRNAGAASFELSVCQNRYNSLQEARSVDESYCDHFNVMHIFFEDDKTKAFINQQNGQLESSQLIKLKRIVNNGARQFKRPLFKTFINSNIFNSSFINRIAIKSTIINYFPNDRDTTYIEQKFKGNPFDRNYMQVNVEEDKNEYPLTRNADCNTVYYSVKEASRAFSLNKMVCNLNLAKQNLKTLPAAIYQFKNLQFLDLRGNEIPDDEINKLKAAFPKINLQYDPVIKKESSQEVLLTRINLDEKGFPDANAQASLKLIVNYLNNYKDAKARIVLFYSDNKSAGATGGYIRQLENVLQQLKYNKAQIKFEIKNNPVQQQQQQQQQPIQNAPSKTIAETKYADVYGTGFPADFSKQLNKKASAY